ncbi:MAG TPA: flagellar filament capping protein FliD [Conexibacter sp.]|nr:flagellar filament capping protein FliD [Conexibacter sp.]
MTVSSTPLLNVGGLASGLDTNSIVDQLMAIERQPRDRLAQQQTLTQARQTLLQDFQTRLRSVESAAQGLRSVTLWAQTQAVESSDPTKVVASSATGAGIGGYQVEVSQLANSAQRTFTFASPASAGSITIDGHATAVAAGASITDVVTAINSDTNATVYAAATDSGTLVLSSRQTGDTGGGYIAVTDPTGALTEQAAKARQGKDAQFTVDGVAGTSSSNTVTSAIAGVKLTLKGVTTTTGALTITVDPPAADPDAIKQKLQAFVDVYNSTVDAIRSKLTEKTVPGATTDADRQKGMLNGDTQLTDLLSTMRQAIYTPVAGLPAGMDSLADLGISTGDASPTISQDALDGKLTLDAAKLDKALATDQGGVRNLLAGVNNAGGWARSFEAVVHAADTTGGPLDIRINGAGDEIKDLQANMASMDDRLALRETALRAQFAAMEAALSQSQSQSQWLSGQIASLQ